MSQLACSSRDRCRRSSSYQTASLRPKVVGSAWTPCVRPIMMVARCATACVPTASINRVSPLCSKRAAATVCSARAGVDHVRARQPEMNEASRVADALSRSTEEGNHIVIDFPLDLSHPVEIAGRPPDPRHRLVRDSTAPVPGLADGDLYLEPERVSCARRPRSHPSQTLCTAQSRSRSPSRGPPGVRTPSIQVYRANCLPKPSRVDCSHATG